MKIDNCIKKIHLKIKLLKLSTLLDQISEACVIVQSKPVSRFHPYTWKLNLVSDIIPLL